MNLVRSGLIVGLVIWAAATAVFVPFGHRVFGPDNRLPVVVGSALVVVATYAGVLALTRRALRRTVSATVANGALFGAAACLPGLLLDGVLYALGGGRYPGLALGPSGAMTATLLLAYGAALFAAMTAPGGRRS